MTVQRPSRLDLAIAVCLTVVLQLELWIGERYQGAPAFPGDRVPTAVLLLLLTGAVAWRRVRPVEAFAAGMGALTVLSVWQGGAEAGGLFAVLLVSTFSAAAWSRRAWPVVVIAVIAVCAHNLSDPFIRHPGTLQGLVDQLFGLFFTAAGLLLGRIVHARGQRAVVAEQGAAGLVAAERARLARELHDVVAHSVSLMVVQAKGGAAILAQDPARAAQAFSTIEASGRQALEELRRMLGLLREEGDDAPSRHAQPGLAEVPALVEAIRATGLEVAMSTEGEPGALAPSADLSAYRVVQEALTNVLRHSGARRADVSLRWRPEELEVRVHDDGTGAVRLDLPSGGRGLLGLRERVGLLGGTVHAAPRPDGGFEVRALLPRRTALAA